MTEFMTPREAMRNYGRLLGEAGGGLDYAATAQDMHRCRWVRGDWTDDTVREAWARASLGAGGECTPVARREGRQVGPMLCQKVSQELTMEGLLSPFGPSAFVPSLTPTAISSPGWLAPKGLNGLAQPRSITSEFGRAQASAGLSGRQRRVLRRISDPELRSCFIRRNIPPHA